MKKLLFGLLLLPLWLPKIELPKIDLPEIRSRVESSFGLYSDAGYTRQENRFSPGQDIYVKVTFASTTPVNAILTLLDQAKSEIKRVSLEPKDGEFRGKIIAPAAAGTYYLHVSLKGEGVNFEGERNIEVVGATTQNEVSVQSEAESIVSTAESSASPTVEAIAPVSQKAFWPGFLKLLQGWINRFLGIFTVTP